MTLDAWGKITPMLMCGYRKINKYVEANPQWWCLEILDGFGAYFGSHYAGAREAQDYLIERRGQFFPHQSGIR